ncbi:MAG: glycosyltransferase [Myxococcales bacterium]
MDDSFAYLCLGRYEPRKEQAALIEAFARVASRLPRAALVCAGEAPDAAYLGRCRRLAAQSGFEARIHLLPHRSDPERLLAAADAFILPSTVEGASVGALQAAASGLPVLLTDTGAARELLDWGARGSLLPPHLPDLAKASFADLTAVESQAPEHVVGALAQAMLAVAEQPDRWRASAAEVQQLRTRIGVGPMAREYERLFAEVARR